MHAYAWSLHTGVLGGMRTPTPNRPLPLVNQVPIVQLFLVLICPISVFTISKFPLFSKVVWVLGEPWPLRLYLPGFWQYLAPQRLLSWGKSSSALRAKPVFSLGLAIFTSCSCAWPHLIVDIGSQVCFLGLSLCACRWLWFFPTSQGHYETLESEGEGPLISLKEGRNA